MTNLSDFSDKSKNLILDLPIAESVGWVRVSKVPECSWTCISL